MKRKKKEQPFNYEQVEKWLENYFLDPLTSLCDMTQFRIDLYETDDHWIVEAVLDEFTTSEITVKIEDKALIITAQKHSQRSKSQKRVRTIDFPFQIIHQKVYASFTCGILEVFISKTESGLGKNRYITLP